jgi:hypothetical protein
LFVSDGSASPNGSVPAARGGEFTGLRWRIQSASGGDLNRPPVANSPARAPSHRIEPSTVEKGMPERVVHKSLVEARDGGGCVCDFGGECCR